MTTDASRRPRLTVPAMARHNASLIVDRNIEAGRGSKPAYIAQGGALSYEELLRQVSRMGHLLRGLGVQREQRVLLVLDNTTVFPIAFLGALRIGAVPIPVSVRERPENFRHFIEDSYAKVVVCDVEVLQTVREALADCDVIFLARGAGGKAIELDSALAEHEDELAAASTHAEDMAFWLYTSGSTGKPKGVVHRHGSIGVTCETFGAQVLEIREDDRIFSTTKLYHAYGLGNCLSFPLHFGATAILLDGPPTPERLLSVLRADRPTVYFSVPALYRQLIGDRDVGDAFDSVRLCVSAAEPLALQTFERWRERFGLEIVDGIGSTEMLQAYCSNRPGEVVPGTTGLAVPGYELRLTDEAGRELEGAAVGMLEVRGDSCASHYWHQHEQTRRNMRGEWFATGDRFERRPDGRYVYVGRADDMLKIGGLWVSPVDMEQVLLEHPAVAGVGVVGVTIDDYSRLAAFVQCEAGVARDEELSDSLRSWCRGRMRDHEYPHLIRFIAELPQTLTGKPQRFKLREMIERELEPSLVDEVAPSRLGATLAELPAVERDDAVMQVVVSEMVAVLGQPAGADLDTERAFDELGFDSLSAVELRNRLSNAAGVDLPSTLIFDYPTPRSVARLLRALIEGVPPEAPQPSGDGRVAGGTAGASDAQLAAVVQAVDRGLPAPRMPSASPAMRVKTSSWVRAVVPAQMAVRRATREAQSIWEHGSAGLREQAVAAMDTIIAGTHRREELHELARLQFIEEIVDRALFWQRPWSARTDGRSARRLNEALSSGRGVLLSACHLGPFYRLQCAPPLEGRTTYLVPGAWFFQEPTPNYWGRRLARWRKGMSSRLVPADRSFRVIEVLLGRGDPVFVFFDMPGTRQTRFLGKPAMLADGSAQLAHRTDALILPLRARRRGHRVFVDVGAPLDPREFTGVDQLHDTLAAFHQRWILENPAAMAVPATIGWGDGATAQAWVRPAAHADS